MTTPAKNPHAALIEEFAKGWANSKRGSSDLHEKAAAATLLEAIEENHRLESELELMTQQARRLEGVIVYALHKTGHTEQELEHLREAMDGMFRSWLLDVREGRSWLGDTMEGKAVLDARAGGRVHPPKPVHG